MQTSEDQTTGGGADTAQQDGAADNAANLANGSPETPKKTTTRKKTNSAADASNMGDSDHAAQGVGTDAVQDDQSGATNTTQTDQANTNTSQVDGVGEAGSGDTSGGLDTQGGDSPVQDVAAPAGDTEVTTEQGESQSASTTQPKESGVIKVYNKGRIKIEPVSKIRLGSLVATDIPFKTSAERDQILASIKSLNHLKNTLTTQVVED